MPERFVNNFKSSLSMNMSSGAVSMNLQLGDEVPLLVNGDLDGSGNFIAFTIGDEIVRANSNTDNVFVVQRGYENTNPVQHLSGTEVTVNAVAGAMDFAADPNPTMVQESSSALSSNSDKEGKFFNLTNAGTVTVTLFQTSTQVLELGFQMSFIMSGTGSINFVTEGSDVIVSEGGLTSVTAQYGIATVIKTIEGSPNTWHLSGSLS